MATTDRTATTTESGLIDVVEGILTGYLEDGERREDIGEQYGTPALATAHLETTTRKGELRLRFENGEEWALKITASVTKRAPEPTPETTTPMAKIRIEQYVTLHHAIEGARKQAETLDDYGLYSDARRARDLEAQLSSTIGKVALAISRNGESDALTATLDALGIAR